MPFDPTHSALAAFGVTAAFLTVGGAILLRLQRDRQHFQLMQTALEKGIHAFPGVTPSWLISLRVGMLSFVLGLGLVGAGIAIHVAAGSIADLPAATSRPAGTGPAPAEVRPEDRPAPPEGPQNAGRRGGEGGVPGNAPPPPPPPPAGMERWHRVETQQISGLATACAGCILALLGIVRMIFARFERAYSSDAPAGRKGSADVSA